MPVIVSVIIHRGRAGLGCRDPNNDTITTTTLTRARCPKIFPIIQNYPTVQMINAIKYIHVVYIKKKQLDNNSKSSHILNLIIL